MIMKEEFREEDLPPMDRILKSKPEDFAGLMVGLFGEEGLNAKVKTKKIPSLLAQARIEFPALSDRSFGFNLGANSFLWAVLGTVLLNSSDDEVKSKRLKDFLSGKIKAFEDNPSDKKYAEPYLRKERARQREDAGTDKIHSGNSLEKLTPCYFDTAFKKDGYAFNGLTSPTNK